MSGRRAEAGAPLMPDSRVRYGDRWWRVGAVGVTGGERYYWLVRRGEVAMLPWFVVERA
jgi:hypothetical protein